MIDKEIGNLDDMLNDRADSIGADELGCCDKVEIDNNKPPSINTRGSNVEVF